MQLTSQQLKLISPSTPIPTIEKFLFYINDLLPKYGIDTPIEICSFLAQVLHESGGLKFLTEIWGPTSAQLKYEGNKNLGNTQPGDGKKFLGRGLIQITGRSNYSRMSLNLFKDSRLLESPELLALPQYAVESACVYWIWRKMDLYDDDLNIMQETKLVNGKYNGLEDRQAYFNRAVKVLIG